MPFVQLPNTCPIKFFTTPGTGDSATLHGMRSSYGHLLAATMPAISRQEGMNSMDHSGAGMRFIEESRYPPLTAQPVDRRSLPIC